MDKETEDRMEQELNFGLSLIEAHVDKKLEAIRKELKEWGNQRKELLALMKELLALMEEWGNQRRRHSWYKIVAVGFIIEMIIASCAVLLIIFHYLAS